MSRIHIFLYLNWFVTFTGILISTNCILEHKNFSHLITILRRRSVVFTLYNKHAFVIYVKATFCIVT